MRNAKSVSRSLVPSVDLASSVVNKPCVTELDAEVRRLFDASDRSYGSPRIHRDLLEAGWTVNEKTVAESMQRQDLQVVNPSGARD